MNETIERSIKPILDVYDKLNDLLKSEKIEIPKIVVVGDQSSGKSSVLESITGISLPRGENTVTKCPIIIQLRTAENDMEYALISFDKKNGDKLKSDKLDIKNLEKEIRSYQEELLKERGLQMTLDPLTLNVFIKNAPNLTLYDLPGITYKSDSMTNTIREIYKKYTESTSTIILLVLPLNTDLSTSEAISIVRNNSEYNKRTIPIITKIDLGSISSKKKLSDIILEVSKELELTQLPVAVKNRSQDEIDEGKLINEIYDKEYDLLNNNQTFIELPEDCKGSRKLIERLVKLQKEFLLDSKLGIKVEICKRINEL